MREPSQTNKCVFRDVGGRDQPPLAVGRVTRLTHLVRTPDALAGGVGLAKALGERAAAPSALLDPGPHVESGRYVTFWTYRPEVGA